MENEGSFQALPPDVYFVGVRLGRSIQRLTVEVEVILIQRDSRDLREFLRGWPRHLIKDLNHEALLPVQQQHK